MTEPQAKYKLVSADGHLNEARDVWTSRVAKKDQDRVPRVDRLPEDDRRIYRKSYSLSLATSAVRAPGNPARRTSPSRLIALLTASVPMTTSS